MPLPDSFFRGHYSHIANLRYACGVDKELKMFEMQDWNKVYICRPSLGKSVNAYDDYLLHRARGGGI